MEDRAERPPRFKEMKIPLLVKIQSIELENLEIRSLSKVKHVTCVEGTNKYLIIGCTSGTVYLFSREKLQFLCVIPFKGGKVCCISCPEDEADIAIGSIRGKVSIYRIFATESLVSGEGKSVSKISVQQLCSISHHVNNEITEMQWSPNGRYLFIGDSQGIISQVDVGSLDEFPRPLLSRIILQVGSRVLQIDCIFPYIAINTVGCVFLCDIESENFTRIRNPSRDSLQRAAGVCLVASQQIRTQLNTSVVLYVGALNSSTLLRYSSDGTFLDSTDVEGTVICKTETRIFDPKRDTVEESSNTFPSDVKLSIGKLISCDDECLISATNNQIVLIDPQSMCALAWSDEFRRISSVKVVSNYVFIWETGKIHVVASTFFRSYAQQLLQAKLMPLLNNWILHSLNAAGYREYIASDITALENKQELKKFVEVLMVICEGYQDILEDDELFRIIFTHLPPSLAQKVKDIAFHEPITLDPEEYEDARDTESPFTPFQNRLQEFLNEVFKLVALINQPDIDAFHICDALLKALMDLYIDSQIDLTPQDEEPEDAVIFKQKAKTSNQGIDGVIQRINLFLNQNYFACMEEELQYGRLSASLEDFQAALNILLDFLKGQDTVHIPESYVNNWEKKSGARGLFTAFSASSSVKTWFRDWGVSMTEVTFDALIADFLVLLSPFLWWLPNQNYHILLDANKKRFFTWVALILRAKERRQFPYSYELRNVFSAGTKGNLVNEVITAVYNESEESDVLHGSSAVLDIFNFVTLLYFKMKKTGSRNKILTSLVTNIPYKDLKDSEIRVKLINVCKSRQQIFNMYHAACKLDGKALPLCKCGLPGFRGYPSTFLTPRMQRLVEESLLEIMYHSNNQDVRKKAFRFAMERLLLQRYMQLTESTNSSSEEEMYRFEIILRSGMCKLLQDDYKFSEKRLELFLKFYASQVADGALVDEDCHFCQQPLKKFPNFRIIPWDCLGIWMAKTEMDYKCLMNAVLQSSVLNTPGTFSLRFYQILSTVNDDFFSYRGEQSENPAVFADTACSPMHAV